MLDHHVGQLASRDVPARVEGRLVQLQQPLNQVGIVFQVAIDMFKRHDSNLVLMAMHMPVKVGYAATREIRQWEKENSLKPVQIIALTANALKEDEQKSLDSGCNAHLTKPINKFKLIATVNEYSRRI